MNPRPFAALTPHAVLDALEQVGLHGDGRLLTLNSFENRVVLAHLEDGRAIVAKFYRPGRWSDAQILEEHALMLDADAAGVPLAPPWPLADGSTLGHVVVRGDEEDAAPVPMRLAVHTRRAGHDAALEDPAVLQRMGATLGALHRVGETRAFAVRPRIDAAQDIRDAWQVLSSGPWFDNPDAVAPLVDAIAVRVGHAFAGVQPQTLRLHGDAHRGNVLWRPDEGPVLVDFDDAVTGPAMQDLWMLLPGDDASRGPALDALLAGYRSVRPLDDAERHLIEPLRARRLFLHAAWLAERWRDPAFPAAFPWFGERGHAAHLQQQWREQLAVLDEAAD